MESVRAREPTATEDRGLAWSGMTGRTREREVTRSKGSATDERGKVRLARRGAVAARRAHNPKVDGSNPSAATSKGFSCEKPFFVARGVVSIQHIAHSGERDDGYGMTPRCDATMTCR